MILEHLILAIRINRPRMFEMEARFLCGETPSVLEDLQIWKMYGEDELARMEAPTCGRQELLPQAG